MNNKDVIVNYSKTLWDQRDLSIIDRVFAPHTKIHSPLSTVQGKDTMHDIVDRWLSAFPDMQISWDEFIAEGNTVVSRWSAHGTHLGSFFDTRPSHREATFSGVIFYRLEAGKIIDYWSLIDMHAILSQLEDYDSITEALET